MKEMVYLSGSMLARIVSDDLYGDIAGRRLAIATSLSERSQQQPERQLSNLWVLNRFRDPELLSQYKEALGCKNVKAIELRGERVTLHFTAHAQTHVLELDLRQEELDACEDAKEALRYLANPNVARNAAIAFAIEAGASRVFVLDGDIFVPSQTWEQIDRLLASHGPDSLFWMFTIRAWSIEEFFQCFPPDVVGRSVVDTCGNEFELNSWPPRVTLMGDEGMLGIPPGTGFFDEHLEYGRDPKVAYCEQLKARGLPLVTPSYPVCHLEHRVSLELDPALATAEREQRLLEHRMDVRKMALSELLGVWRNGTRNAGRREVHEIEL